MSGAWPKVGIPCCRIVRPVAAVPIREPQPSLATVLDYLARCERAAELANNRDWRLHYSRVWRFVFDTTHGALPSPFCQPIAPPVCEVPVKAQVPKWKRELLTRPMRRVVRELAQVAGPSGAAAGCNVVRLQLECGHIVEELAFMLGDKPALRRRCKQCAKEGRAAVVIHAQRKAAAL